MKYNICGFNQKKLIEYKMDGNDVLLLRGIIDIYSSNAKSLEYKIIDEDMEELKRLRKFGEKRELTQEETNKIKDLEKIENEINTKGSSIHSHKDKYMWLTYGYLFEQFQILGNVRTVRRKVDILIEKKILKKEVVFYRNGKRGKYLYIAPGLLFKDLLDGQFYSQGVYCGEDNYTKESCLEESEEPIIQNDKENNSQRENSNQRTNCPNPSVKITEPHRLKCPIKDTSINNTSIDDKILTQNEGKNKKGYYPLDKIKYSSSENPWKTKPFQEEKSIFHLQNILDLYKKHKLPPYEFPPTYGEIQACLNSGLTIGDIDKAFSIMSKSRFVMEMLTINVIFKPNTIRKALNGSFDDKKFIKVLNKIEKKRKLNIEDNKVYQKNNDNEELFKEMGLI